MRNLSPTERGYLTDPEGHSCFVFAEVTNADGTWINLSDVAVGARNADFLTSFSFSDNQDANTFNITITLMRDVASRLYSLSPFRSDSLLNVDDSSGSAPLADLHRQWRLSGCILPLGSFPSSPSDYREWWTGFTDRIDVEGQGAPAVITLQGRGKEADIIDARIIDVPKTYAGAALATFLQDVLDQQHGVGVIPLTVDGSAPSFFVNARDLGPSDDMGEFDLLSETAALPGALLRYKYDSSDVLSFTLFAPNRNPTSPDWTTDGGEYEALDVGIGLDAVRNYIIVRYMDASFGLQSVTSPATPVSASITRYGLRVMVIDLAASTTINDQTAAGNLADAIRSDMEFPIIEHTLTAHGLWFAELGDYVQLAANGIHYDTDQFGGITSIQHTYANGELKSVLGMRAKPSGRYRGWLDYGPGAPRTLFTPGITKYSADYWETYALDGITLTGAGVMDLGEVNQYTRSVAVEVSTDPTFGTVEFIEYTDVTAGGTFTHQWAGASRASIYYFRATPWSGPLDGGGMPTGVAGPAALAQTWNTPQVPTKPAFDNLASDVTAIAGADVLVKTANAALSAERVVTDTSTVEWDWATSGQAKAKIVSSAPLPGSPTTTTQSPGDNSTKVATTAFVKTAVDAGIAGLSWKQAVRAATTVAGTLASSFENGDTVDGVTLATGNRILIKNQSSGAENGIYTVNASGAPTRATDADAGSELVNATMYVSEGTTNADTQWTCTNNATPTLGSTSLTFAQLSTGGGVTTTGSPASGNLTKFSGAATITNGDLSGDVTTSGTLATTLAASGVAAATYGSSTQVPVIAVDAKGRITSASNTAVSATTLWRVDVTRTVSVTVDDTVEIGSWGSPSGVHKVTVRCEQANSVISKGYWLSSTYNGTSAAWQLCYPAASSINGGADFELEIKVTSGTCSFRLRRTAVGTSVGAITAYVTLEYGGDAAPTFTPSTTTSTSAITARYTDRFLLSGLASAGASDGQVLIWDDTNKKWIPSSALVSGTTATTQSANDNSTKVATTAYADTKAPLASPALTGTPTAPTASFGTNTTQIATTAFVIANAAGTSSPAEQLITETVLGGTAASVSFTSISGAYRDLRVVIRGRGDKSATFAIVGLRFNNDTAANYDVALLDTSSATAAGQSVAATSIAVGYIAANTAPASTAGGIDIRVFDYRGTTFHKALIAHGNLKAVASSGNLFDTQRSGWWRSTSAVTRVDVFPDTGNFIAGTVVSLYGIL